MIASGISDAQRRSVFLPPGAPQLGELEADEPLHLDPNITDPESLLWDSDTGSLLLTEPATNRVYVLDTESGDITDAFEIPGLGSGPAVFDPTHQGIFVVDNPTGFRSEDEASDAKRRTVVYEPLGPGTDSQRFSVPITKYVDLQPITGLALDDAGELWISAGGWLCACIYRQSVSEDVEPFGFFPGCDPVAISIDPEHQWLWIAANNGDGKGVVLLRRPLHDLRESRQTPYSVLHTAQYLFLDKEIRVKSLAATSGDLWILGKEGVGHSESGWLLFRFDPTTARPLSENGP
jgi:hypothetical protein